MASAIQISRHHLAKVHAHAASLKSRLARVSHKAERAFDIGVGSALTVGAGAALGLLHGRHGPVEIMGVPLELGAGAAGVGAALLGVGGKWADHIGRVGAGMLTVYGYNTARGAGINLKLNKNQEIPSESTARGLPSDRVTREEEKVLREAAR